MPPQSSGFFYERRELMGMCGLGKKKITTKFGGKSNFHYDLHVWDSCNEEPLVQFPAFAPQIPELKENLSFEAHDTNLTLFYSTYSNGSKPVVGYPPYGAHLMYDPATYLLSLGNRRFCTFRSGYEVSPFQDPYNNFKVCVNVFSLKEEMREVKVDEEEVSVSLEIEESPQRRLHIRGCFAFRYEIADIESYPRLGRSWLKIGFQC